MRRAYCEPTRLMRSRYHGQFSVVPPGTRREPTTRSMFAFPSIRSSMRLRSSGRCEPSMSISQISVYPWSSAHVKPSTYAEPSPSLPLRCNTNTRESIVQPLMRFAIFRSGVLTRAS